MTGTLYRVTGSVHDQIVTEGAAEVVTEASAEIAIVAANIDAVVTVAENIGPGLDSIPEAVQDANASAVAAAGSAAAAQAAATSAIGTDVIARGYAEAAAASATTASGAVDTIEELLEDAGGTIEQITDAVQDAEAAAALAERWANEVPDTEVEVGKFSALHYATATERMLATAPNLQFRTFGPHPGEEGSDGVDQVFNNTAGDFGRGIAIDRLATRTTTLKLVAGLFNGPPSEGADLTMVPTVVSNIGAADCTIEGPSSGSVSLEPAILIGNGDTTHNTNSAQAATSRRITLAIPAGTNRRFMAVQGIIYHSLPGSGAPALTCSAAGSTVTQRDAAGDGNHAGTSPIKGTIWTGTLPDGGALAGVNFDFNVPELWASTWAYVLVVQNALGQEDADLGLRAGTGTVSTFTGLAPSIAESMAVVVALQHGAAAHPLTIAPGTSVVQGKTPGGRSLKDFTYAISVQSDRPASGLSYTATSSYGSPGVIGGCVFTPVTGTVGGGSLLWRGTPPAVLQPGNIGVFWAMSDGLRYILDMVET